MYISNLLHFLNEDGNIPKEMPREAREMASFLAMVVDLTTKKMPTILTPIELPCFNKVCHGTIKSAVKPTLDELHWYCPECENEGTISNWQGTKWDNA